MLYDTVTFSAHLPNAQGRGFEGFYSFYVFNFSVVGLLLETVHCLSRILIKDPLYSESLT